MDVIHYTDDRVSKVCWAVVHYFLWGAMTTFITASFVAFSAFGVVGALHVIGQLVLQ